jgi:hypothetical protein
LEEYVFAMSPEVRSAVKDLMGQGKTVNEIVTSLRAKGVEINGGLVVKPAEQMAIEIVAKISQAKEGTPLVFETMGRSALVSVLAAKLEPIDEAKAQPFIETYLVNKQKAELARETMKQLHDKAKIEFAGEFAGMQPGAGALVTDTPKPAASNEAAVSKGIAGLK